MPIDEERLRQRLRQYDFDEEEIETLVARAVACDKVMTPEDKERMFLAFFAEMMQGIPYSWDAEGRLHYDQADMDRKRAALEAKDDDLDEDDEGDDFDAEEIARN